MPLDLKALMKPTLPSVNKINESITVDKALSVNPDEEVKRQSLAVKLDTTPDLLPDTKTAELEVRKSESIQALNKAAGLAKWIKNGDNAKVAGDDFPALAAFEAKFANLPKKSASIREVMTGLSTAFKEGSVAAIAGAHAMIGDWREQAYTTSGTVKLELNRIEKEFGKDSKEYRDLVAKFKNRAAEGAAKRDIALRVHKDTQQRIQDTTPEFDSWATRGIYDAMSSTLQMAPAMAAGIAANIIAPGAGAVATLGVVGAQEQTKKFADVRSRGGTYQEAMLASGLHAGAEVYGEALPMGYLFDKFGGKTGFTKFIKEYVLKEVPGELATEIMQDAVDVSIANPDASFQSFLDKYSSREGLDHLAYVAYTAALGAGMMGSPHAVVQALGNKIGKIEDAAEGRKALQEVKQAASETKLMQRSPEKFNSYIEELVKDNTDGNVYVTIDSITPEITSELAGVVPNFWLLYQDAKETGSPVISMPAGNVLKHLVGANSSEELINHLMLNEDGLTYAQAEKEFSTIGEDMEQAAQELLDSKVMTEEEFELHQDELQAKAELQEKQSLKAVPVGERRKNTDLRAKIKSALAQFETEAEREDYLIRELLTDQATGLGNRRAFEESDRMPIIASIDADSLKFFNDKFSMDTGDEMLSIMGRTIGEVVGEDPELVAYHTSGDEFYIEGFDPEKIDAVLKEVQSRLKTVKLNVTRPDGAKLTKEGLELTYAIAQDKKSADFKLKKEKTTKERLGQRAKRGTRPGGVTFDVQGTDWTDDSFATYLNEEEADNNESAPTDAFQRQTYADYLKAHKNRKALAERDKLEVKAKLSKEITKATGFTDSVNEANIIPVVEFYAVMADKLGTLPSELYKKYPLKITTSTVQDIAIFQGDRGSYSPSTVTISLLSGADLSTFQHESAHFFLEVFSDLAKSESALQEDWGKVLDWLGVTQDQWNAMDIEGKRKYHEQWAESYERWLFEGNAPTAELQPLFSKFRSWIASVYKSIERMLKQNPDAGKLNDEMRSVFSRLIATDTAIENAQVMLGYEELYEQASKEAKAQADKATEDAKSEVQTKLLRDLQWYDNAKSKMLKKLQRERKDIRSKVEQDIKDELLKEPVHRLRADLKSGVFKLQTKMIKELLPDLNVKLLSGLTSANNGANIEHIADMYGYKSTIQMINELVDYPTMDELLEPMVDQRMLEEHGEYAEQKDLERAAREAIANKARAKFLATSIKELDDSQPGVRTLITLAKTAAKKRIGNQKIRNLKPNSYMAAEARANKEVLKALKSTPQEAATQQRIALLNNQLFREASLALTEVDKGVKRMKQLQRKASQENMRGDFLDQLNGLLARFDIRTSLSLKAIDNNTQQPKESFKDFIRKYAEELSAIAPDIPAWVYDENIKKHYKDMTVGEFRGVMDAVKSLEMLARREEKQYRAIRDMTFAQERNAVLNKIKNVRPDLFDTDGVPTVWNKDRIQTAANRTKSAGEHALGYLVNAENIIRVLDGGKFGVVNEILFSRLSEGLDAKADRMIELTKFMEDAFAAYTWKEKYDMQRKELVNINGIGYTRENIIVTALLYGNKEGRDRLANFGWKDSDIQNALNKLQSKDLDLIEKVWELFDKTLWPELEALNKRTRGKAPPKVESQRFNINGRELTGGYFRINYDPSEIRPADFQMENIVKGQAGLSSKTLQGTSEERLENVSYKPSLSFDTFGQTVNETLHDLYLREAGADTLRVIKDKHIVNVIRNAVGEPAYDAIRRRVQTIIAPPINMMKPLSLEWTLSKARRNTVVTLMSGLSTALQNFTGLFPVFTQLDARYVLPKFLPTEWRKLYKNAQDNSSYMRGRIRAYDRSLVREGRELMKGKQLRPEMSTMLWFMSLTDKITSSITWNAALEQGLAEYGNDMQRAIRFADHTVRQTQGAGREADVSAVMEGGEVNKIITMFYSHFNAQLGLLVQSGLVSANLAKTNRAKAVAKVTRDFIFIVALPAVLTKFFFTANGGEEEEEKTIPREIAEALGSYTLGMFPLVRSVGAAAWGKWDPQMKDFGYQLSPIESAVSTTLEAPEAIYDIAIGEGTTQDEKNAILGVSYLIGLPGNLIAKTYTGTKAFMEGEAGPSALIFGAPYRKED